MFEVFRVKNHDFTPKKHIFFQSQGGARRVRLPPLDPPLNSATFFIQVHVPCQGSERSRICVSILPVFLLRILPKHPSSPPGFCWFMLLDLQFYVYVLQTAVCPSVLFLLGIVLSVLLRFTDSDYPFGIFKLFLYWFLELFRPHSIYYFFFFILFVLLLFIQMNTDSQRQGHKYDKYKIGGCPTYSSKQQFNYIIFVIYLIMPVTICMRCGLKTCQNMYNFQIWIIYN